jgi:hypothetical protein
MNGRERAEQRRWERDLAEVKAKEPKPEPERKTDTPAERAVDSVLRAGRGLGTRSPSGMPPVDHDYVVNATVSKDGKAVIVRMTPTQALRFVDLIYQAED